MLRQINKFVLEDRGWSFTDSSYVSDPDTSDHKKGLHPAILSHNISVNIKNGVAYIHIGFQLKPEFDVSTSSSNLNNWIKYNTPEYVIHLNESDLNYRYICVKRNIFDLENKSAYIRKILVNTELNTAAYDYVYANTHHYYILGNDLYAYSPCSNNIAYISPAVKIDSNILITARNKLPASAYLGEKKLLNKNNIYLLYYKNIKYKGGKYIMLRFHYESFGLHKYTYDQSPDTNPLINTFQIKLAIANGTYMMYSKFNGYTNLSQSDITKYLNEWSELFEYRTPSGEMVQVYGLLVSKTPIFYNSNRVYYVEQMVYGVGNTNQQPWSRHFIIYKGLLYLRGYGPNNDFNPFNEIGSEVNSGLLLIDTNTKLVGQKKNIVNLNIKIYLLNIN